MRIIKFYIEFASVSWDCNPWREHLEMISVSSRLNCPYLRSKNKAFEENSDRDIAKDLQTGFKRRLHILYYTKRNYCELRPDFLFIIIFNCEFYYFFNIIYDAFLLGQDDPPNKCILFIVWKKFTCQWTSSSFFCVCFAITI